MTLNEPLTEPPPEPEGDDVEAAGGTSVTRKPITDDQLDDTKPLDYDDDDETEHDDAADA